MATQNPGEPFVRLTVDEAQEKIEKGEVHVIDVREPNEYSAGHVPGARLIPVNSVPVRHGELPADRALLFICAKGQRSALACEYAAAFGFRELFNLEGGTDAWREKGLPVEF